MDITIRPKNNQVKCDQKIRFFYDKINLADGKLNSLTQGR